MTNALCNYLSNELKILLHNRAVQLQLLGGIQRPLQPLLSHYFWRPMATRPMELHWSA